MSVTSEREREKKSNSIAQINFEANIITTHEREPRYVRACDDGSSRENEKRNITTRLETDTLVRSLYILYHIILYYILCVQWLKNIRERTTTTTHNNIIMP